MKEIDDDEREWKGDLIRLSYDQLANGGRHPYRPKKIDKDAEATLKSLFKLWPKERRSSS